MGDGFLGIALPRCRSWVPGVGHAGGGTRGSWNMGGFALLTRFKTIWVPGVGGFTRNAESGLAPIAEPPIRA